MSAVETGYKQRLAQMPPDVLPTMHFVSQLPGMGERTHHVERGHEALRRWFGKTQINGEEVVLGIASHSTETDFLLAGDRGVELWKMEETNCTRLSFVREEARHKPMLVPDGEFDNASDNPYHRKFAVDLNFCQGKEAFCAHCVFKDEQNKKFRHKKSGVYDALFMGTFNPFGGEPKDFPMRREQDIKADEPEGLQYLKSRQAGFGSVEKALEVMRQIKEGIMNAEPLTTKQTADMLPDVVYELGYQFDLRQKN